MAFVNSIRPRQSGGSGGQTLNFVRQTVELSGIPGGTTISLSPSAGFEVDENTLIANYNEKLLILGIDYLFTAPNFIEFQFSYGVA